MFKYTSNSRAPNGEDWMLFTCFTKATIKSGLPNIDIVDILTDSKID